MRAYIDSSALAKRYVREVGTDLVLKWCEEADEVILSVISAPEVISALNRLKRERKLNRRQYAKLKQNLMADIAEATIVPLNAAVIAKAVRCLEDYVLRTLDALHIASASQGGCELFVTGDTRQYQAAQKEFPQAEIVGEQAERPMDGHE